MACWIRTFAYKIRRGYFAEMLFPTWLVPGRVKGRRTRPCTDRFRSFGRCAIFGLVILDHTKSQDAYRTTSRPIPFSWSTCDIRFCIFWPDKITSCLSHAAYRPTLHNFRPAWWFHDYVSLVFERVFNQWSPKASTHILEKYFKNAHATLCSAVQNLRLDGIYLQCQTHHMIHIREY